MDPISPIVSVIVVTLILVLSAAGMMFSHWKSWHKVERDSLTDEDFHYLERQYQRRMQTSAMLGVLGLAIFIGYVLTVWLNSPIFTIACWIVILLVLSWTCLLALVDIWATKQHFGRLRDRCLIEQARLRAELSRMQATSPKDASPSDGRKNQGLGG